MKSSSSLVGLLGCCWLAGCGGSAGSDSERASAHASTLVQPAQVSPDFALDQDLAPEPDGNGSGLAVASSSAAGYMLLYRVPYAPEPWSRFTTHGNTGSAYATNQLALVRWDAVGGAPSTLVRVPISDVATARAMDVGNGWLIVYDDPTGRHSVVVSRDGSFSPPKAVLGSCGMVDFARSATTALLTDSCNNAVLFDLAGQMLTTFAFPKPTDPFGPCPNLGISGGQLAFNGIDYLAAFDCMQYYQKSVLAFVVSPAGDVQPSPIVISQPAVPYKGVKFVDIAGNSNGTFLVVLAQDKSSGPEHAITYRKISETAEHVFSLGPEQILPGEAILNDGIPSDTHVSVAEFGSDFAITRTRSTGVLDLVLPNTNAGGIVTTQLLAPLSGSAALFPDDQFAGATRLMMFTSSGITRWSASAQQIDVPPASVFLSKQRGQYAPSLAFDGQNYLAAWTEGVRTVSGWASGNAPQIFGHRVSESGELLGTASFAISPTTEVAVTPLVAANPSLFSAAWNSPSGFLTGAATITDANPPVVATYPAQLATPLDFGIVTDGTKTTVAWTTPSSVLIAQLASASSWSTPLLIASNSDPLASAPAVAFNSGQYAVVWTALGALGERVLSGARVSAAMTLLDSPPKELLRFASPVVSGLPADTGVELVAAGDHFIVAWTDIAGSTEELRVARLSSTLQMLDPTGILVGTQPNPIVGATTNRFALDWDGANVWVVWRDNEGGTRRPSASLRGRRFSDTLAPVDSESFLIAGDLDEFSKVTLARGAGDSSMVGYTRYQASTGAFRARARLLSGSLFSGGVPCGSAAQCQSGACVTGSCSTPASGAGGNGGTTGGAGASGSLGSGGAAGIGGTVAIGGTAGFVAAGGSVDVGGSVGNGGTGGAVVGGGAGAGGAGIGGTGNGGTAGLDVGGTAGISGSVSVAGTAGLGGAEESAGASEGGASGASVNVGGEAGASDHPAGSGGGNAVAGQAGTGGNAPDSPSCSCHVVGAGSTNEAAPPLAGLLVSLGAVLLRRRRSTSCNSRS